MLVFEQIGHVDERAIALAHDIRGRAIAIGGEERHVAHRHPPPAVERDLVRDRRGLDMHGDRGGERFGVDRAQFGQALRGLGAAFGFGASAMIAERGFERGAFARVDAERHRVFRVAYQQRLGVLVEQRHRGGVARRAGGGEGAGGEGGGRAQRGSAGNEPAAIDLHGKSL